MDKLTIALVALGTALGIVLCGTLLLSLNDKDIPDLFKMAGTGCLTGILGVLVPNEKTAGG